MYVKFRKDSYRSAIKVLQSRGTSLIEVLISVLILGIGLLGIASMQAITLRNGQSSMERGQAVMQSYSIFDAMRSNVIQARAPANAYNMVRTCALPAGGTLAQNDLRNWIQSIQTNLGATSCGTIVCDAPVAPSTTGVCTVTVDWNDSRGTRGSALQETTMRSRI